ncbi:hypothetical protein C8J57DRAFT_238371 [Mycena rebaudengoi]|nr:hypothetical protein C8J57DRAFT_238371 [Mycena rebaudengoi]
MRSESEVLLCDACGHTFSSDLFPSPKEKADLAEILRSKCEFPETSLRGVISGAPAELARCDMEIARQRGILDELQAARDSLQSCYNTCRSIVSALRRLPSEILCDIFALIPPDARRDNRWLDRKGIAEEIGLAQVHLLRVASVCSRWHVLVMGTPALWSEILLHLWDWVNSGSNQARMLALLNSVLDRGGDSPMTLRVERDANISAAEPLTLVAQHSRRWRRVTLSITAADIRHLSAVNGQLPLLEALTLDGRYLNDRGSDLLDLFGDAPRLTSLTFHGSLNALSAFSDMKRLQYFSLQNVAPAELSAALSFADKLSRSARFVLGYDLDDDGDLPLGLAPVVVSIKALDIIFTCTGEDIDRTSKLLGEIFDNLTLDAQELSLFSDLFVEWPHLQSLAFFSRSSLSHSLKVLEIPNVVITEDVLAQCLGVLPALEKLVVSDQYRYYDIFNYLIIDSLLRRLTWTPDPSCLVPRLNFLVCRTMFNFDDDVFLEFVLSRLEPGRKADGPFNISLVLYNEGGYECESSPALAQRLRELPAQKQVVFLLTDADPEDPE